MREAVGLMDMSFMAKFAVRGADAGAVLDRLSAGAVNAHDGVITYTQWLGEDGGILADLTVTRLAADDFLVVVSDTAHGRALGLLRQAVGDAAVTVDDVTTDLGLLTVQGPASRDTLAAAAPEVDWSTRGLPVPGGPPGHPRRGRRAGHPDHLPRRARLGAVLTRRPHGRGVGCRARGG